MWLEFSEICRLLTASIIVKMTTIPQSPGPRIGIGDKSFIKCVNNPQCPKGKILILQGGVYHFKNDTYYIRLVRSRLPNYSIYVFEHLEPIIGLNLSLDIDNGLKQIGSGTILIGYSMGGMLLWNYLADGYDSASRYIPVSCPINIYKFYKETIHTNMYCRILKARLLQDFQASNLEDVFKSMTLDPKQIENKLKTIQDLLLTPKPWNDKTIWIFGLKDTLIPDWSNDIIQYSHIPHWTINNGTHCCLDSIFSSIFAVQTLTMSQK